MIAIGGSAPSAVWVGRAYDGLAAHLDGPTVLVTDDNVERAWGGAARAQLGAGLLDTIVLPAGEAHKTVETWSRCVEALVAVGADRRTVVVALGGGVLGDLAGFAAATALRGLPWVALPTTLLAMVDAAIGGKTAVNLPAGKNLVGAFHMPRLVWAATDALSTLPARELAAGFAEVVKTALVGDPTLLDALEGSLAPAFAGAADALPEVVHRCAAVKAGIVTEDPREQAGRIVLNLGHTAAHALETATSGALTHGEAVAIGLVAEARWAVRMGVCRDPALPERVAELVRRAGLPTAAPAISAQRLLSAMRVDKKGAGDKIRVPLPERAGRVVVAEMPRSQLADLLPDLSHPPRPFGG